MEPIIIQQHEIFYELNRNNLTAYVINSPNARGTIFFPPSIRYESQEYQITSIKEGSFQNNKKIKSIEISDKSKFKTISKNALSKSGIRNLFISSQVDQLEDGWCHCTDDLNSVTVSPSNKTFKYLDDTHQIIIGKSDIKGDIFDTVIFANRDIKHASIPKFIKYIKPYAFQNCKKLETIEIQKDSELVSICDKTFSYTSIENFFISPKVHNLNDSWCHATSDLNSVIISPSNKNFGYLDEKHQIIIGKSDTNKDTFDTIVIANRDIEHASIPKFIKYIKPYAFECCTKLKAIEFSEDSEIVSIGKKAFGSTNIESFFIPSSLEKLDGCINYESKLTRITIPPSNKNFGYLDEEHQIIVGKSDTNKDIFDTILFANRDIKQATIPCFIKYIKSYAFNRCDQLNHVEFSENSELLFIGKYAFCHTSIEVITIPKSVTEIEKYAFCSCNELKKVSLEEGSNLISLERGIFSFDGRLTTFEIPMDSKLQHFCANVFMLSSIESVYIPENVDRIDSDWCCDTKKLKEVKISPLNKHFKYLDEEHQIIVGKSDIKGEKFDTIVFVSRRLENIIIPKYIKYILSSAFDDCKSIETISIPEDSELISIPNNFASKSIKSLFIPQSVEAIENSWCHNEDKLNSVVISPSNKNFSYLDEKHQIIVGKSDTKGTIPKSIEVIQNGLFQYKL